MLRQSRGFIPDTPPVSWIERFRAATGALLGILLTGLMAQMALGQDGGWPLIIAPMGATAILLFAVPSSPLAQPWSVIGGNTIAAFIGVSSNMLIGDVFFASSVALAATIAILMTCRCLHPPSGAIALTAVLGGPAIHDLGFGFIIWPVFGNTLILLILAYAFNNLSGRPYPHSAKFTPIDHKTSDVPAIRRIGFSSEDLDAVLQDYDEFIDIEREDLEAILRRAEFRSYRRRASDTTCSKIMSRDVIAVESGHSLSDAFNLMREHRLKALPVTNEQHVVIGIVTQTDFIEKARWIEGRHETGLRQRLRMMWYAGRLQTGSVQDIMTPEVVTVHPHTEIIDAMLIFAEQGVHYLPVVEENGKLAGILSQSDVMVAMLADKMSA